MVAAARRFVIAGLGNYHYPLTRHSAGQILLKALAHKAPSLPHSSGTPHLKLDSSEHVWSTIITGHSQNAASARGAACLPFELMFCLPKRLMNVCGPVIVEALMSCLGLSASASASMVHLKSRVDGWKILTLQDDLDLKPGSFKIHEEDHQEVIMESGRPENKGEVASYFLEPLGRDEAQNIDWDERIQRGGELVEQIWLDVMRIAQEHASNKPSTST